MSDTKTIVLVGASGFVGSHVLGEALGRDDVRVISLGRREFQLPLGGRSQLVVCEPERWGEAISDIAPDVIACAIGATLKRSGSNADEFRAVEHDLVLKTAHAAREAEVPHWISISAAGADRHLSDDIFLQVKGEVEEALRKVKFRRTDILRPGAIRGGSHGQRGLADRLSMVASPVIDLLRPGSRSHHRPIDAREVAKGILQLAREKAPGKFIHDNEAIGRAARRLPHLEGQEA